jgi:naphthoate synthase
MRPAVDDSPTLTVSLRAFNFAAMRSACGSNSSIMAIPPSCRQSFTGTPAAWQEELAPLGYETILYEEDGPIGTITLNRPDDGNMFNVTMCHEVRDCINEIRRETRTRVIVVTGAGDRFFCIGGRKDGMEDTHLYAGVLPTLDMYESIERLQKPVIASVNGYAVGGGHVLHVMCDLTIAKESAIFRQVGPMMGSFDAGFGTWYLEDLVGKKKAKEIWMLNPRMSAQEAVSIGLINKVVPDDELKAATREMALAVAERGAFALASIKAAFGARHGGVGGLSRMTHDLLLRPYLETDEAHELGASFAERRKPDPDKIGH